jgi:hypothetical protein
MSPVDTLEASQRAVLQLVLQQGKGYGEIAELLGLDADAVRTRAHGALQALGPRAAGLTAARRAEAADYLLGQQSESQAQATRAHLAGSAAARAWARAVAGELRSLADVDLPPIPDGAAARVETEAASGAEADGGEPLRPRPGRPRSSRVGGIVLLVGVAALVAVGLILLLSGGSDDEGTTTTAATATRGAQTRAQPTPVAQINLRAADGSKAVGVAQVLAQGNQRALAIVAQRLTPSTRRSAYAVWLYTSKSKSKLLGYVDPPVGKDGRFANFNGLPPDADRYRELIVTRETGNSKTPGEIVLRGSLNLS